MLNVATDAASMEIDAGVTIAAGGCAGEGKAKLFAIGGKHGMLASGAGGDRGDRFSGNGLLSFAIRGEVTGGTAMETAGVSMLVGWLG